MRTSFSAPRLLSLIRSFLDDVYIPYFNPNATENQILAIDHIAIVVCALSPATCPRPSSLTIVADGVVMGLLGVIFFYAGISMGWLYEFMGT